MSSDTLQAKEATAPLTQIISLVPGPTRTTSKPILHTHTYAPISDPRTESPTIISGIQK